MAALAAMNPNGCQRPTFTDEAETSPPWGQWQPSEGCGDCPLADAKIQRAGLLWIGEKFYKTPEAWAKEARDMGVCRRIKSVPHGFKLGETWVALAHIKAIPAPFALDSEANGKDTPGIFRLFKPTAIEYVVKGTETPEELADLEKRGITPVKVERIEETAAPVQTP